MALCLVDIFLCIGIAIFPLLVRLFLDNFSYFGTYLLLAALVLNGVPFALLLFPLESPTIPEVGKYQRMAEHEIDQSETNDEEPRPNDEPTDTKKSSSNDQGEETTRLKTTPSHGYHSTEGPSETIVVSTLEKSWKFDSFEVEEYDEDEADDSGNKVDVSVDQVTTDRPDEQIEAAKEEAVKQIPKADIDKRPITLLEVMTGLSNARQMCQWYIVLFLISNFLFYFGVCIPLVLLPSFTKKGRHLSPKCVK